MKPFRTHLTTTDLKIGLEKSCVWNANKTYVYRNVCALPTPVEVQMECNPL